MSSSRRVSYCPPGPLSATVESMRPRLSRWATEGVPACSSVSSALRRSGWQFGKAIRSASQDVPRTASFSSHVSCRQASKTTRARVPLGCSVSTSRPNRS